MDRYIKFLCVIILLFLFSCKKEESNEFKVYDEKGKLNYIYKKNGDILNIFSYEPDGKLAMKLKFRKNQFIDTIYYKDYKHHYIVIDSSRGQYFYGTEIILFDNWKYGYVGPSRFIKNKDPRKVFKSQLKYGEHITGYDDGSINEQILYVIENDSSVVKAKYIVPNKNWNK